MTACTAPSHTATVLDEDAANLAARDASILAQYQDLAPWGLSTAIDLAGCHAASIRDADHLTRFVVALCDLIAMRRFGPPVIVRFGDDARVCGYSLTQLIETSLISGHFAEESNSAYIDIFSCTPYPPYRSAAFCRQWFGAVSAHLSVHYRCAAHAMQGACV